jgi:hypothetical protein
MSSPSKKKEEKNEEDYNNQSLRLSKIFAKWPDKINVAADGTVNMSQKEPNEEKKV